MTEPIGVLELLHHDSTRAKNLFQPRRRIRNEIPAVLSCNFDRDHIGTALLHLKGEETAGGTNFQNALTGKIDFAEIIIYPGSQIPIPSLYDSMAGKFHGVVKVTVVDVFHFEWRRKNLVVAHGCSIYCSFW